MYRILIAAETKKDYLHMVHLLASLSGSIEVLEWVRDMMSFVQRISEQPPNLIIVPISLPGFSPYETVEYVRYKKCPADIIIVSDQDDFAFVQRALRMGVSDYILRARMDEELPASVSQCCQAFQSSADRSLARSKKETSRQRFFQLAEREFMLSVLLKHPDEVVFREITGAEEGNVCWRVLAAEGCHVQYPDDELLMSLKNQVFDAETCLALSFEGEMIFLVAQARTASEDEHAWLVKKAELLLAFIAQNPARSETDNAIDTADTDMPEFLRVGISGQLWKIREFPKGLEQARQALQRINVSGFALFDSDEPSVYSRQENFYVEQALNYMEDHFGEKITLSKVADAVGISGFYLSKLVHSVKNQTFTELLAGIRTAHAVELLADESRTAQEVSELCGYSSVNYFYKAMKRQTGMTVKNLRRTRQTGRTDEDEN